MNKYISRALTFISTLSLTYFLSKFMFDLTILHTFTVDYLLISIVSVGGMYVGLNYVTGEWK